MTDARYPIVVLLLFLSCSSVVWADVAWTLVTLGDSLTEGAGDDVWTNEDVPLGYPGRLVERLQAAGVEVELHNLGVSGWTSTELIEGTAWDGTPGQLGRAEALVQTAMAAGRKAVALVWVGSNDLFALYEWKCGADSPASCAAADLGEFDANIATILGRLQAAGAVLYVAQLDDQSRRPVLADPAYADAFPDISADELPLMSDQVERYNQAIAAQANGHGAVLVDFFHTSLFEESATLSEDGNHPNGAGYDLISGIWNGAVSVPRTDLVGNGSDGPLTISAGAQLELTLHLDPRMKAGEGADWWLVRLYPDGSLGSYDLASASFVPGLAPSYQGPLIDLPALPIDLVTTAWVPGGNTLFFGVDTAADGLLNSAPYYDWLQVEVAP